MNLGEDINNVVAKIGAEFSQTSVKLAGNLAKEMLLILLEKSKENTKYKPGIVTMKKLLKSGEELQVAKIKQEYLEEFKKKSKKYGIQLAILREKDGDECRLIFKESSLELMKEIFKDVLENAKIEKEKTESIVEKFDNIIDLPGLNEEKEYKRLNIDYITVDKAKIISNILSLNNIKNSIVLNDVDKKNIKNIENIKDLFVNLDYKISNLDMEKGEKIINECKNKSIEELRDLESVLSNNSIDKKIVDKKIDKAKETISKNNAKNKNEKIQITKTKINSKER